jgi:anhydro-N-acetylmuramic acid kinase
LPPPKSTGRELFNENWLDRLTSGTGKTLEPVNVQATLAMLTASSIARQLPPTVEEIYVCGGGTENTHLCSCIADSCNLPVNDTHRLGVSPRWIEAAAFAWLAIATMARKAVTLPSVTGATRPCVAGSVYYPG